MGLQSMADRLTPEQRSYCMSRIRGKNTLPELMLRRAIWAAGCRYRLHSNLPGRPDIMFSAARLVVFIDGCFWHACPQHGRRPRTNQSYWNSKIARNIRRDIRINAELSRSGWKVARFWEHEVKADPSKVAKKIVRLLDRSLHTLMKPPRETRMPKPPSRRS